MHFEKKTNKFVYTHNYENLKKQLQEGHMRLAKINQFIQVYRNSEQCTSISAYISVKISWFKSVGMIISYL